MMVSTRVAVLFAALLCYPAAAQATVRSESPVRKVVTLLEEMKVQVDKESTADEEAHAKFACWCETNKKEKDAAVEVAEKRISELEAFIEEAVGLEAQLKVEIANLGAGIAADQESLAQATGIKVKETAEFQSEENDMKECVGALREALAVLSKVQLLQHSGHAAEVKPLLVQLKAAVRIVHDRLSGEFRSVMQQDLWDVMSSLDGTATAGSFLPKGHGLSALEQRQPNALTGDAAGAKSYNSRSGSIVGILSAMQDDFEKNVFAAQKQELEALIQFQALRASKLAEITAATTQKNQKEEVLADTMNKAAQAKDNLEATMAALSADQKFLIGMTKSCKVGEEEYAERVQLRTEELRALAETIKILSEDNARDIFGKTMSFLQTDNEDQHSRATAAVDAAQNRAVNKAMQHLLHVARQHKDWALASLAVRVKLDSFTQVKLTMDKMIAELKDQQKAEFEKWEFCKKEVDETEDNIKVKTHNKEDLEEKKLKLENDMLVFRNNIEALGSTVADMQVSLKEAGEDRKIENRVFQNAVSDQRATVQILKKALARLKAFYSKKALVQVVVQRQEPGAAVAPPPPKGVAYEKHAGAGGVLQLIDMIIGDASRAEVQLVTDEQQAQENYAALANDITATIEANRAAIAEKTKLLEGTAGETSETEGALLANGQELTQLGEVLKGTHLDCDFLLKYYDIRQKARSEEIGSIVEAKAILSGADFGKALEEADDAEQA